MYGTTTVVLSEDIKTWLYTEVITLKTGAAVLLRIANSKFILTFTKSTCYCALVQNDTLGIQSTILGPVEIFWGCLYPG